MNPEKILILILIAGGLVGCSKSGGGGDSDDSLSPKKDGETKAGVTMDSGTQDKLGIVVTNPAVAEWRPEITAYGRVLDPIPLTDLLADLHRSELALKLAEQEFDRVKLLKNGNNISLKAFQEAEGNYLQTLTDVSAARRKVESMWGKKIAGMTSEPISDTNHSFETESQSETNWVGRRTAFSPGGTTGSTGGKMPATTLDGQTNVTFFQQLGDTMALVRVDLPVGVRLQHNDGAVRIVSLVENAPAFVGTNFDLLPAMDPQTQQQEILVTVGQSATNRLTPGEAVTVYLPAGGEAEQGVSVPGPAIVRYEGKGWVYAETDTNQFARKEVPLDRQLNGDYFIGDQLSPTTRIILTGAQSVLSAELGGGFTTGERD
jgi:multidrug efflux pump subunit AcrA (membrane-fusion protein)